MNTTMVWATFLDDDDDDLTALVQVETVRRIVHPTPHRHPRTYDPRPRVARPVNQGRCGSCWAIAAAQCVEDRYRRAGARVPALSFQHLNDCAENCVLYNGRRGCSNDCRGGFLTAAFEFIRANGIYEHRVYGGRFGDAHGETHVGANVVAACSVPPGALGTKRWDMEGYYMLPHDKRMYGIANAREELPAVPTAAALAANQANICEDIWLYGSVASCFNMFSDFAEFAISPPADPNAVYRLGWKYPAHPIDDQSGRVTWTERRPGPGNVHFVTGHAVCIVGWGETPNGTPYWIVRNSWGRRGGWVKVLRGANCSAIESDVEGAVVAGMAGAAATAVGAPSSAPNITEIAVATAVVVALVIAVVIVVHVKSQ
jgi:hypothetical protein